ncbi:MAG: ABC transporter substrate-binding protein [Halofilum sp. (in: g-proteobacteria)]
MRRGFQYLIGLLVLLAIALAVALWPEPAAGPDREDMPERKGAVEGDPAERRGALVDQVVFTQEGNPGKVVGRIESGSRQVFAQGVTNKTVYHQLRQSEHAEFELSYGSSAELTLNPSGPEFGDGELNPFAVPEIREAMNWLVDRDYIASELYGGLAAPRYLPLSTAFPDYARLSDVARELEVEYGHKPRRAREAITREMEELGATRGDDGHWMYEGSPVRIKLLIRTEDARKQIGDYVANRLEELGFETDRMYRTADQAGPIWLGSDPAAGRWHIYTGGWVSTVINRDQAQNFADFYTPEGRSSPLWQAYEPSDELREIAQQLSRRDYESAEDRESLMARALRLSMKNSARIWLTDGLSVWPYAADVELAMDLAGGLAGSRLWPYTLRYKDRVGGEMIVSSPSVLTEPWNPVAGTNWLYDTMMIRATEDAPLMPDPFTGLYWPQRIKDAAVTVVEDAPVQRNLDWLSLEREEEIRVPDDAWIDWDGEANRFVRVDEKHPDGITARTRTRIRYEDGYLEREWHDGSKMSLADLVLPYILEFERADEDSPLYDRSHVSSFETFKRHFRGWRIVSRDPLIVDVYSDQIYPDAETIVAARAPATQPWHTLGLGIRAETNGDLAFSSDKADQTGETWLSMVSGPSLPVLDRHRRDAAETGWVPFSETLGDMTRDGGPEERYTALADWREKRGHYWVGDGPFYLDSVHPVEGSLVMRRDEDFPDRSDKWLRFTEPQIPVVSVEGPMTVATDEGAQFRVDIRDEGEPYPRSGIDTVEYLLLDPDGDVQSRGEADAVEGEDGFWQVSIPREHIEALGSGANRLEVTVKSNRVALPRFGSHAFATLPPEEEEGE